MEDEVCKFQKYGFCQFKEGCRKKHLTEICDSLSKCKEKKHCQKRHPKNCKRFASGTGCRHEEKCAYNHHESKHVEEQKDMKEKIAFLEKMVADFTNKEARKDNEKVEQLEIVVKALVRKVLSLESELKDMKTNKGLSTQEHIKENVIEVKEDISDDIFNPKSYSSPKEKETRSQPKVNKDEISKSETKENFFKCTKCKYKSKKQSNRDKHILTSHGDHGCKECNDNFKSFIELLKHVAKYHFKEPDEVTDINVQDKEIVQHEEEDKEGDKDIEEEPLVEEAHKDQDQLEELEAELSSLKKELLLK